jgi:hypothetical protein
VQLEFDPGFDFFECGQPIHGGAIHANDGHQHNDHQHQGNDEGEPWNQGAPNAAPASNAAFLNQGPVPNLNLAIEVEEEELMDLDLNVLPHHGNLPETPNEATNMPLGNSSLQAPSVVLNELVSDSSITNKGNQEEATRKSRQSHRFKISMKLHKKKEECLHHYQPNKLLRIPKGFYPGMKCRFN